MRYFYNDPLVAAYMAKHFGMKFYTYPDGSDLSEPITWENEFSRFHYHEGEVNWRVHPDSLQLLERRMSDICQGLNNSSVFCVAALLGDNAGQIIQRDGKRFFWPESEEA